jgi:hypothetical protein
MATRSAFVGMMLLAALLPVVIPAAQRPSPEALARDEMLWPPGVDRSTVERLPLSAVDQRFADRFPGQIARFTDGSRIIIMRAVSEPTRMLHSAAVCFRGLGYRVESPYAMQDSWKVTWGCFRAERDGMTFSVCERIYDASGAAWNDVSSWYWAALLGRTGGPWYAMTVVSPS